MEDASGKADRGLPPHRPGPLFSKRARQIQADEGIVTAPLLLGPGRTGEAPQSSRGRSRAGTLPSSWGEIGLGKAAPSGTLAEPFLDHGAARGATAASQPVSGFASDHETTAPTAQNSNRLRSGSLTSPPPPPPPLSVNPFGAGIFSSPWIRSDTNAHEARLPSALYNARPSLAESLDGSENVRTLDYLGLADPRLSVGDASLGMLPSYEREAAEATLSTNFANIGSRHRASTVAVTFGPGTHGQDVARIFGAGSNPRESDLALRSGEGPLPESSEVGTSDLRGDLRSGRTRAGTLATLVGPGARHRAEQELSRMGAMGGRQLPSSGVPPAPWASVGEEQSNRALAAPPLLEGFPHVDIHTPPALPSPRIPTTEKAGSDSSSLGVGGGGDLRQVPTRSLYVGNLRSSVTGQDLMGAFAPYGAIESLRLLSDKNAGFVNFAQTADAVRAMDDVTGRLAGNVNQLGAPPSGIVRVGYGKIDALPQLPARGATPDLAAARGFDGFPGAYGGMDGDTPTRALWIGSIPASTSTSALFSIFAPFGAIESARILQNKNCAFINFERVDDAVRARKMLNGCDVLGPEVGSVRIGFARVPASQAHADMSGYGEALDGLKGAASLPLNLPSRQDAVENYRSPLILDVMASRSQLPPHQMPVSLHHDMGQAPQHQTHVSKFAQPLRPQQQTSTTTANLTPSPGLTKASASGSIVPSSDKGGVPLPPAMVPRPTMSDLQLLMRELSEGDPSREAHVASVAALRPPVMYYSTIPLVSEVSSARRFDTSSLRDLRKTIEAPQCTRDEVDFVAREYMDVIVDLASDYIGNTVVQKFFERCSEPIKQVMLGRLAPHLAMIGIHKNGTWAAQKIIDTARTPEQIGVIAQNLRPYVPPLLLDQFGNYVVQCCLPWPEVNSEFIFDAMIDRCWEIAQGRFGARSMRACLESPAISHRQRKRVATAIILNAVPLATSPNGALLLTWLLDASNLPGRYRLLVPRFSPHLSHLCTHKLASLTVLRIINQKSEPLASTALLNAIFDAPHSNRLLEDIISDQVHGAMFVTKALASANLAPNARQRYVAQVARIVQHRKLVGHAAYRRLTDELGLTQPMPLASHAPPPVAVPNPALSAAAASLSPHPGRASPDLASIFANVHLQNGTTNLQTQGAPGLAPRPSTLPRLHSPRPTSAPSSVGVPTGTPSNGLPSISDMAAREISQGQEPLNPWMRVAAPPASHFSGQPTQHPARPAVIPPPMLGFPQRSRYPA